MSENLGAISSVLFPVHRAGWPFIGIFAACTIALAWLWMPLGFVGIVLTVWCACFFRDPDRFTPIGEGLVISPADGVVQMISDVAPPEELRMGTGPCTRISIFMNVFNVHVNRAPISGRIKRMAYRPGKFLNASMDKASEDNERQALLFETADGQEVGCVQIAGLIARRILCDVTSEQKMEAGERFGMIRFGSRVDVYLPLGTSAFVVEGQQSVAGETVLADLNSSDESRRGEKR